MLRLPNCVKCGTSKRVEIVECLGDNEWVVVYRVCCTGCGSDWMWQWEIEDSEGIED